MEKIIRNTGKVRSVNYEFVTCKKCNRAIILVLYKTKIWLTKPDGQYGPGCTHARRCIGKDLNWYRDNSNSVRYGRKRTRWG